jgi:hypothetical protein
VTDVDGGEVPSMASPLIHVASANRGSPAGMSSGAVGPGHGPLVGGRDEVPELLQVHRPRATQRPPATMPGGYPFPAEPVFDLAASGHP